MPPVVVPATLVGQFESALPAHVQSMPLGHYPKDCPHHNDLSKGAYIKRHIAIRNANKADVRHHAFELT